MASVFPWLGWEAGVCLLTTYPRGSDATGLAHTPPAVWENPDGPSPWLAGFRTGDRAERSVREERGRPRRVSSPLTPHVRVFPLYSDSWPTIRFLPGLYQLSTINTSHPTDSIN